VNPFDLPLDARGVREITFMPQRAVEAILYIAEKISGATMHTILKAMYAADKDHLSRYGSFAIGDHYVAMQYGPVASNSYNLMKAAKGEESAYINPMFYSAVEKAFRVDGTKIESYRSPNMEWLAKSVVSSLDSGVEAVRGLGFSARTSKSHDAAWEAARQRGDPEQDDAPKMFVAEIAGTLSNASNIVAYLDS
jgi:uncharacterized phage-associated protein